MVEDIINNIPKEMLLRGVIAKNIKALRKKHKITQEELAKILLELIEYQLPIMKLVKKQWA